MNPESSRQVRIQSYKDSLNVRLKGKVPEGSGVDWLAVAEKRNQDAVELAFLEYNDVQELVAMDARASSAIKGAIEKLANGLLGEKLRNIQ